MKPPTGFQALDGRVGEPRCSQPFRGKFLSFAVRTKIGAVSPSEIAVSVLAEMTAELRKEG